MGDGVHPLDRLSAHTQGSLSRRRVPDPPLPLRPGPAGWAHHLASPVHHVSRGVHDPPPLRLTLSPDATGGGPRWPQFGALCGDLPYLAHGALSPRLCTRPTQFGQGADSVWPVPAHIFPSG